jgi:hypothetical protein
MTRTKLLAAGLIAALGAATLGAGSARADAAPLAARDAIAGLAELGPLEAGPRAGREARRSARLALAMRRDPAVAVIVNLRAIERLYRHENRSAELPGLYADVLKRTEDPLVRNFANYRLARMELREQDAKGALEALRRNLNENLARLGTRPAG